MKIDAALILALGAVHFDHNRYIWIVSQRQYVFEQFTDRWQFCGQWVNTLVEVIEIMCKSAYKRGKIEMWEEINEKAKELYPNKAPK